MEEVALGGGVCTLVALADEVMVCYIHLAVKVIYRDIMIRRNSFLFIIPNLSRNDNYKLRRLLI